MKNSNHNVKNTLQIHSQAKVDFYKTYLERYLAILCKSPYIKNINIYDVFVEKAFMMTEEKEALLWHMTL